MGSQTATDAESRSEAQKAQGKFHSTEIHEIYWHNPSEAPEDTEEPDEETLRVSC